MSLSRPVNKYKYFKKLPHVAKTYLVGLYMVCKRYRFDQIWCHSNGPFNRKAS